MTGNIRHGLGLLVVALAALLIYWIFDVEIAVLAALALAAVGFYRLASGLLRDDS